MKTGDSGETGKTTWRTTQRTWFPTKASWLKPAPLLGFTSFTTYPAYPSYIILWGSTYTENHAVGIKPATLDTLSQYATEADTDILKQLLINDLNRERNDLLKAVVKDVESGNC